MGRGGQSLVLLCCATLLLISASAVSGDEQFRNFRKFGRLRREHLKGVVIDEPKTWKPDWMDEKKPAEGIWEKARSYLSGLTTPVGNGVLPNHVASLFEKKNMARAEEAEKSNVQTELFRHHRGVAHSHWDQIRDLIRHHPERISEVGISATEPMAFDEDMTADLEFQAKLRHIVGAGVGEYINADSITYEDPTCAGALEFQVKILVKGIKSALRDQLCSGDVVSTEEERFCNLFSGHPMMATLEAFAKTRINPVLVAMRRVTATAACSSVNPFTDFMDSLKEMETLALQAFLSPEGKFTEDKYMEHDHESGMFHRQRHEHEDHEKHWWQRMFPMHHHHHFDEKHEWHHELNEGDNEHEVKDHEKHWWHHMFRMFFKHKHMRHRGFEHAHENFGKDCFSRSLKHIVRGVRYQLVTTCQSATSPNVISACKFAKEHHFLVKAWLAVQMPVWSEAAKRCALEDKIRVAPDTSVQHDLRELASDEAADSELNRNGHLPLWIPTRFSCAGKLANPAISKALHLRGHLVGLSSSNDGGYGLPGLVRTHLIVLREHRLHLRVTPEAFDIAQLPEQFSSGEMLSDLQEAMTEKALFKPFQRHPKGPEWTYRNFRISANPRVLPTSEGLHFRISAKPRSAVDPSDEIPTEFVQEGQITPTEPIAEDDSGDTESTEMVGSEVELQDKTAKDTTENRADM